MLYDQVKQDIVTAMKARDEAILRASRNLSAAFTNELVALKRKPQEKIDDENALNVVKRLVKQRKDSIEQFRAGGREDLVKGEAEELVYLEKFLPQMMSRDEIRKIAEVKKTELGVTDKSNIGQFMGAVMKELKGRANGTDVKAVIEELLQ